MNASDAVNAKHQRTKKTGVLKRGKISIATRSEMRIGSSGVLFEINDSGDGVPKEIRNEIFIEFFTTKDAGSGTGLGLAICEKIASEHGGTLTVTDSTDLGGAKFKLWLPLEIQAPST